MKLNYAPSQQARRPRAIQVDQGRASAVGQPKAGQCRRAASAHRGQRGALQFGADGRAAPVRT